MKDKALTIIAPIEDTPADKAGVLAGDIIIKIDGEINQRPQPAGCCYQIKRTKRNKCDDNNHKRGTGNTP